MYSSSCLLLFIYLLTSMPVFVNVKEDISRLIEEGRLEFKFNELDQLENAAKNNADPAWSVNGTKTISFSTTFCFLFN